ncbi:DNA-processing protein DprA [Rhizobiaceae bacterium]|nr:DNA-processing protein DprA [Rhizobiaceae bacterium]
MNALRPGIALSDEQRLSWLQLARSQNVGPVSFVKLINHFGSASEALAAVPELVKRAGGRRIKLATRDDAERELAALHRGGGWTVCMGEPDYPSALRAADGPPPLLSCFGQRAILREDAVAFVGSRNASISGVKFTRQLAADVARGGYAVVSGLARGIDAAAHEATVKKGTVAVFAGGIDVVYPHENRALSQAIPEHGVLITEMPLGWKPRAQDFPRRNRIVAGMSLGVVVVEAARRSGSLITARLANEMGRQVFAVPGSPLDPRSDGANHLIRQGATLITCADDVLSEIGSMSEHERLNLADPGGAPDLEEPSSSDRERLLEAIGQTPTDVDDLLAFTSISAGALQMLLLELDLSGALERHSGNRVSRVQD